MMDYRAPGPEYNESCPEITSVPELPDLPEVGKTADESRKEFEYASGKDDSVPRRKTGRFRNLLLQAAAVMIGGTLVLNSFGVDFLGMDGVFNSEPLDSIEPYEPYEPDEPPVLEIDPYPEPVESKWPTKVMVTVYVTYRPTGAQFIAKEAVELPESEYENGTREPDEVLSVLPELRTWIREQNGDPDTLSLYKAVNTGRNQFIQVREGAIISGSSDSPERMEVLSGEAWWEACRDEYYYLGEAPYDDEFPDLPNPDPDFAGDYAWAGEGSEEYLILVEGRETHYLVAGTYYTLKGLEVYPGDSSAYYDRDTNTLVLNNYHGDHIDANVMGNGFKIELLGENEIGSMTVWGAMYGGSVTFTGNGSLKINQDRANQTGLMMECEYSQSCLMVDRQATVEVYGEYAIVIHRTMLPQAIYALRPVEITGGECAQGEFVEYSINVTDEFGNVVFDENGQPMTKIMTVKDIAKEKGIDLYDYSVVGSDGKPAPYVKFAPAE